MKISLSIIVCLILNNLCYSQVDYSEDWVNSAWQFSNDSDSIVDVSKKIINKKDLSFLLKSTYPGYNEENTAVSLYGLVGENFEKIEFVFTDIEKSDKDMSQYLINGKTKYQGLINNFSGSITFNNATAYISENKEGQAVVVLTGSYKFTEGSNVETAATFIGKLKMILSTKNLFANDILFDMDMYYEDGAVRGFVGIRKTNKPDSSQSCIWGFLRFPYQYANRFDIGAGEEIINIKYAKPWFNFSEEEWNNIINGTDKSIYLHTDQEDKGIHTSEEEYSKPDEATWFKLAQNDLEKIVFKQLNIDENNINFITAKALATNFNETVIVFGEIEYNNSGELVGDDYGLISHILIVNSVTGKIKYHYTENSKNNGWTSDAIFITEISLETPLYQLTKSEVAFGVKVSFRSGSQPNPYSYTSLSLYIKEDDSLKKVLDNFTTDEYSGVINVNINTCFADINTEKDELTVLESSTNGYYDIQVKNTIVNSIFEVDANGECEAVEKSREEKTAILKYHKTKYE